MKTTLASLASGDQIILGASETEMITVEKKKFVFCLNETCKDLASNKIFPFDARKADRVDEKCTHYVLDSTANPSLELICAKALNIPLVERKFVEELSRSIYPETQTDTFNGLKEIRFKLFKSINVMDAVMDPLSLYYLGLLGASVSQTHKESYKNIILSDQMYVLLKAIEKGELKDLDVLIPKPPPSSVTSEVVMSTESIVVPDSPIQQSLGSEKIEKTESTQNIRKDPAIRNGIKRERKETTVSEESDVQMVSTFVDLYRPARPQSIAAPSEVPNFKRFKKSNPSDRKAAECIGFADMAPYKGVMETGGVNQSKTESWLVGDTQNTKSKSNIAKPVQAVEPGPPKFRSSFFSEGLQFE